MSQIIVDNPMSIGGNFGESIKNQIETWESDLKYYENYLYDRGLIVGRYYEVKNGKIEPYDLEISDEVKLALKKFVVG
jgi:DNA polymerase family B, exonuclease domain.